MDQRVAVHKKELPKSFRVVCRVVVRQHNARAADSIRREKLHPPHAHPKTYIHAQTNADLSANMKTGARQW
jgi:hypothetical protein